MKFRLYNEPRLGFSIGIAVCVFISIAGFSTLQADDKTYKSLKLFTDVLEELEKNYVDDVDTEKLIHNAIKGMVGNLDPHSSFMPPQAFDELQDDTKGEFSGIGIVITMKDSILTVVSPIEGTPAYNAGIQAGDMIIRIDDKSTKDMELWEAVNLMRGPRHKAVLITVIRQNEPKPIKFSLMRDMIPMESVRSVMLKPGYGYLRITNFRMSTLNDIKNHLEKLESQNKGLKGLIMDLRDNPGGLLDQAVKISDLFLAKGNIVSIKGRKEVNTQVFKAFPSDEDRSYPVVVLINGGSASASEIVAGALQDHSRALILGTTSFGKGSVQTVHPLRDKFGIKYTIARYYTPNGRSIQAKGIEPDIEVEYEILTKKEKKDSAFDRMIKEKDLKNSLKPEMTDQPEKPKKQTRKHQRLLDTEQLQHDAQVKRALDILISYGVFSKLNGS
ncbi:MAG: S41 family peptidase [Desulfobacula sp.]|mgnify:CR=1 FL=1|uniref:S41 family peptidase n=1 Tax=Desulfobacula sp. TaxID=2593537 RepID=UPI001D4DDD20|nr:S41 family peptidase [Desulfobacula sp.]MBT3484873.1 S41 family peptidase [Desulfobacula sp.]MBT3804657.1 S41 family peptidase [Desulfobacula sp.]MBT4024007.1 S41 family peptidase [Desulfobacula sp.]MBT4198369.1 S41 family peptidase [Desulfobacula sp.]